MGAADEQIRVSDSVKREIDRRRREGESYNDVLERMFSTDRDREQELLAGAGFWSSEKADRFREERQRAKETRKERMRQRAGDGE
jgi:predicted CopG family antitoxin